MLHLLPFLTSLKVGISSFSIFLVIDKFSQQFKVKKLIFESKSMSLLYEKMFVAFPATRTQNAGFIEATPNHQGLFLQFFFVAELYCGFFPREL